MGSKIQQSKVAKNAVANIASGTSSALLAVFLPPVLVRTLSPEIYATWVLILQIGAYTGILAFGIQVAVGRFVAHYDESEETTSRNAMLSTAFYGLFASGLLGALAMCGLSIWLGTFFPRIPAGLILEAQLGLVWVGVSLAAGLPFSVFVGIFIGRQRNQIPAIIQISSKIITGTGLIIIARQGGNLLAMAKFFALINFVTYGVQYFLSRRINKDCRIRLALVNSIEIRKLWDYCLSLSVWNLASVLVTGLDLVIVGRVDFISLAPYSIASGLVAFIAGLQNAVCNVLIPLGAILGASGDRIGLRNLLIKSTRVGVLLLLASGLPLFLGGAQFLRIYVGPPIARQTLPLLWLLIAGNVIRLVAAPYATLLIGTGQQRKVLLSPIIEGVINLFFSILLGYYFGASGVAIGTIIGAIAGLLFHLIYNIPRTIEIPIRRTDYLRTGILMATLPGIPWLASMMILRAAPPSIFAISMIYPVTAAISLWMLNKYVLTLEEIKSIFRRPQ